MQAVPGGAAVAGGALSGAGGSDDYHGAARCGGQQSQRGGQACPLLQARRMGQVVYHQQLHPRLHDQGHLHFSRVVVSKVKKQLPVRSLTFCNNLLVPAWLRQHIIIVVSIQPILNISIGPDAQIIKSNTALAPAGGGGGGGGVQILSTVPTVDWVLLGSGKSNEG